MTACSGGDLSEGHSEPAKGHRATPLVSAAQQATLSASDASLGDYFGLQVAIEGDTAVVLAQTDNPESPPARELALYIFVRGVNGWVEWQKLTPKDHIDPNYYGQLAIHGERIVMGTQQGVYIFHKFNLTWQQEQKIVPPVEDSAFGATVAIDGDNLVVGAPLEGLAGYRRGAAYVYKRFGYFWSQEQRITSVDTDNYDMFGYAVAIDGDRIAIGADAANNRGAAYIFAQSGTAWVERQKLQPEAVAEDDEFGGRLALKDGTLVVGSPGDDTKGENTGALYVFTESNATWVEQAKLHSSEAVPSQVLGFSVAIDGSTIVAGTKITTENGGAAYTFERSAEGQWAQHEKLSPSDPETVFFFGYSVAVSGSTKLVGALVRDPSGHGAGYVFAPSMADR